MLLLGVPAMYIKPCMIGNNLRTVRFCVISSGVCRRAILKNNSMFNKNEIEAYNRGYRMLNNGILLSPNSKKINGSITRDGYYETGIRINGKTCKFRLHRLQAYQKYNNKIYNNGIVVRHLNGNCKDNSYDNICIGTDKDNKMDMPKNKVLELAINASKYVTKYSNLDVIKIKEYYKLTKSYKKTMTEFGISSKGTLYFIIKKR